MLCAITFLRDRMDDVLGPFLPQTPRNQGCGVGSPVIRLRLLASSIIRLRLQLRLRPDSDLQLY